MGTRSLTALVGTALALCAPASGAYLFATVAHGHASGAPEGAPQLPATGAILARTSHELAPLAVRLRPSERERLGQINFRRYVAVAAFASGLDSCSQVDIARVVRKNKKTLIVDAVYTAPGTGGCLTVRTLAYHVVKLRRASLGRAIPSRIVLKFAVWGRSFAQ